jgi:hypothetical protein
MVNYVKTIGFILIYIGFILHHIPCIYFRKY